MAELHLGELRGRLGPSALILQVEPGEQSKTLANAGRLYDELAAARIERDDLFVTFGGGVVGDLGGFVAATWLRGIPFVQIPTTLEAAVDASVGGKTGVNHPAGKNLIGAFHQPSAVIIDTDFLSTLPARDFAAGLGESVKHAVISGEEFLAWHERHAAEILARDADVLSELIARNCAVKADIVSRDEREAGLRAVLNYGHTVGHALEHFLDYELRHGECVGLGMIAANELSCRRGLLAVPVAERIRELLSCLGLPGHVPRRLDPKQVVAVCRMDKKARCGAVNFMLARGPGQIERVSDVADAEIVAALAAIES